jgi:uncharacterized cupin superfamily protein
MTDETRPARDLAGGESNAMETKLLHLSQASITTGVPSSWANADRFAGKHEARLAKSVGITQFGLNYVILDPGSMSSSRHWHEAEDEFVYVLSGRVTLIDNNGEHDLTAGSFAGFPAGISNAHHLVNKSNEPTVFIVVGSRKPGEETIHYPDDTFGPVRK